MSSDSLIGYFHVAQFMHHRVAMNARTPGALAVAPVLAFLAAACGGEPYEASLAADSIGTSATQVSAASDHATVTDDSADTEKASEYRGPSVGAASGFAALAHSAVAAAEGTWVTGSVGVSGASLASITGFDRPTMVYGTDSSAPNSLRTVLTQREVDVLVDDIYLRPCDAKYTELVRDAAGIMTIHPGVTCVDAADADLLLSGTVTLDAGGDPNAFFVIRSNFTLTVADDTQVLLEHGAQACSVFWRAPRTVTVGSRVQLLGTIVAGTALSMNRGSTLVGRALAQTEAVLLAGNTITIPVYDAVGSARTCSHQQ
jgi:hypothetical protein